MAAATQDAARLAREKEALVRAKEEKEREVAEAQAEHEYLLEKAACDARARKESMHRVAISQIR